MNTRSFLHRFCQPSIPRFAIVTLVVLAWISIAYGNEIHDAAQSGDLEKVKALLKDHPELVNSKDTNGLTPLHLAAEYGFENVAELLLANGADVNARDKNGATPLHWAAREDDKDVAELLLASNADVNARDNNSATPLHDAALGQKDVVELLLANGANVNARDKNGSTPLDFAAFNGYGDVAELLQQHGGQDNSPQQLVRKYLVAAGQQDAPASNAFLSADCKDDFVIEMQAYTKDGWIFSDQNSTIEDGVIDASGRGATVMAKIVFKGGNPPAYLDRSGESWGDGVQSKAIRKEKTIFSLVLEDGKWKISGIDPAPSSDGPGISPNSGEIMILACGDLVSISNDTIVVRVSGNEQNYNIADYTRQLTPIKELKPGDVVKVWTADGINAYIIQKGYIEYPVSIKSQ